MRIILILISYLLTGCILCFTATSNAEEPKGRWLLILFWPLAVALFGVAGVILGFFKIVMYIADCIVSWFNLE